MVYDPLEDTKKYIKDKHVKELFEVRSNSVATAVCSEETSHSSEIGC